MFSRKLQIKKKLFFRFISADSTAFSAHKIFFHSFFFFSFSHFALFLFLIFQWALFGVLLFYLWIYIVNKNIIVEKCVTFLYDWNTRIEWNSRKELFSVNQNIYNIFFFIFHTGKKHIKSERIIWKKNIVYKFKGHFFIIEQYIHSYFNAPWARKKNSFKLEVNLRPTKNLYIVFCMDVYIKVVGRRGDNLNLGLCMGSLLGVVSKQVMILPSSEVTHSFKKF